MTAFGLRPRDVLALARAAQRVPRAQAVVVHGELAGQLARELAADGRVDLVRVGGEVEGASALVLICAGAPAPWAVEILRTATRKGIPVIVVQLGDPDAPIPYALATDVVPVPAGTGFPIERVARRLAARVGREGVGLASELPRLRPFVKHRRIAETAVACAALAGLRGGRGPLLPALSLLQAAMLRELDASTSRRGDMDVPTSVRTVLPELGVSIGVGLGARSLVRRLPVRGRLVEAAVAGSTTLALGLAADRARTR